MEQNKFENPNPLNPSDVLARNNIDENRDRGNPRRQAKKFSESFRSRSTPKVESVRVVPLENKIEQLSHKDFLLFSKNQQKVTKECKQPRGPPHVYEFVINGFYELTLEPHCKGNMEGEIFFPDTSLESETHHIKLELDFATNFMETLNLDIK